MAKLGFIGLGSMGAPMAGRLIEAGHELTLWNRTLSKAEAYRGRARIAESPRDVARSSDAVITMVSTPEALSRTLFGEEGVVSGMRPGTTLIDMSTVGPDHIAEVTARLPEGVELIDAPVLGSVSNAADGTLKVFVGASEGSFARWREVFGAMGFPLHLGPSGSGAAMKLVANSTLAGVTGVIGEALALADGFGLEQKSVISILVDSPIGPAISRKLDMIESDRYAPSFKLSLMLKDIRLVLAAAERRGVELRVAQSAERWIDRAEHHGLGSYDYSALIAEIRNREVRD